MEKGEGKYTPYFSCVRILYFLLIFLDGDAARYKIMSSTNGSAMRDTFEACDFVASIQRKLQEVIAVHTMCTV